MALMLAWNDDFRAVFWVAVVPGLLSFALIAFAVREPPRRESASKATPRFDRATVRRLGTAFWAVTLLGGALTLARFSEAFLILRSQDLGLAIALAPLVLVGMNLVFAAVAYPVGKLADRIGTRGLLAAGIAALVASDVVLACATGLIALAVGVVLWGLHMGLTQGLLAAMVAEHAPAQLRGTAFGVFNLVSGIAMLAASVIAGALWQWAGPQATFWAGAVFAALSLVLVTPVSRTVR
jgi:MFS family permease